MREFLEDALDHRDDGYGRAQKHIKPELPKRFYAEAGVAAHGEGFAVTLDGRVAKTPGNKVALAVPARVLAEALAGEWAAQGERIDPAQMPLVRLVNSALESGEGLKAEFREEILRFAGTDMLLYRAESPRELVVEQERLWDAALVAVARRFSVGFQPTVGILHQAQPEATLARLGETLRNEGLLPLAALVSITAITGSGILAIGLRQGLLTPEAVWEAAHLDEDFQARLWGVDPEAAARRAKRRVEFDAAVRLLELLPPEPVR